VAAPLRGDVVVALVARGEALPLLPLGETQGVGVTERLAAGEPPAGEVAAPLRVLGLLAGEVAPLRAAGLPLAPDVAVPLRAAGLPLAAAVALPLLAEPLGDALAARVAEALAARLGAHVTPLVVAVDCSLSSPQATAKASRPTAIAIGIRARTSWRFISASFVFDCYLNISNEHETCSGTALNCNFITTSAAAERLDKPRDLR
jgi:hypothetical protein